LKNTNACSCGQSLSLQDCCLPFIQYKALPSTTEQLMRSRFTAYCLHEFEYILNTYCDSTKPQITAAALHADNQHTQWLRLQIVPPSTQTKQDEVEFKAYYKVNSDFYCMHERSRFEMHKERWLYLDGVMLESTGLLKIGRNDPCICGSGKKFKRCCQA